MMRDRAGTGGRKERQVKKLGSTAAKADESQSKEGKGLKENTEPMHEKEQRVETHNRTRF